jgi:WD40 repeat protein
VTVPATGPAHQRPYPGMRPFERNEADLFFGQEEQIAALLKRLGSRRLLAVLGESGCGKSSLVKAGMIPTLLGRRSPDTALWRIAVSQPGTAPIRQLAESLATSVCKSMSADIIEQTLRSCSYGLMDLVAKADLPRGHRVLIVIDQFEELFRLWRDSGHSARGRDEAALFVKLLLAVTNQRPGQSDIPVYLTLTMRSEYLGDSALFFGLAEAINEGAYLLPKMSRSNVEAAIVHPLEAFNAAIDNDLLQVLLNEAEIAQQDGLPLLQHGLRQLWDRATERQGPFRLTLADLHAVDEKTYGSLFLEKHFNEHLDGLLSKRLTAAQRQTAQALITQLGEYDAKGGLVRRTSSLAVAAAVCGVNETELLKVVDVFRDDPGGQSFLMPTRDRTDALLNGRDSLNICHEALLRHWATLRKWIEQEMKDGDAFRALATRAVAVAKPPVLRGSELTRAGALEKRTLTEPWSRRYQGPFDAAAGRHRFDYAATVAYLRRSRNNRTLRNASIVLGTMALLVGGVVIASREVTSRERNIRSAELVKSSIALKEKAVELERSRNELKVKADTLNQTVGMLTKSREDLARQVVETSDALDRARKDKAEADRLRNVAEQATTQANDLRAQAVSVGLSLENALRELEKETAQNLAASERRDREQALRLLAAREPSFDPAGARLQLEELAAATRSYASAYGQVPSTVLQALGRAVELSYVKSSDTQSGEPVLLAMPDPSGRDRLAVIRRGMSAEPLSVAVDRQMWTVQRATQLPGSKELLVGGAGGFAAMTGREDEKRVTRKLHPFAVSALASSTDGKWVATASAVGDIRLLRHDDIHEMSPFVDKFLQFVNVTKLFTFLAIRRFKGDYAVRELAISVAPQAGREVKRRDVSVVALTDTGRVVLWQRPGPFGKQLASVDQAAAPGIFSALATNPATQEVWMSRGTESNRTDVGTFDLSLSRFVPCPELSDPLPVSALAWNERGDRLALGFRDGSVRIIAKTAQPGCQSATRELDIPAHRTAVTSVSWHGDLLASGSSDGSARLWTMPRGAADRTLLSSVRGVAASATGGSWPAEPDTRAFEALFQQLEGRVQSLQTSRQ